MSRKLPCGHLTADLVRDPIDESVYRCPSCKVAVGLMPPMDVCRWVDGTFQLPAEGGFEAWTGRVFLAVCAGGMQDPESCYCAEYAGKPRDTIRHLRDRLESMHGIEDELRDAKSMLGAAMRLICLLRQRLPLIPITEFNAAVRTAGVRLSDLDLSRATPSASLAGPSLLAPTTAAATARHGDETWHHIMPRPPGATARLNEGVWCWWRP